MAGERGGQWDASFLACGDCPVTLPGGIDSWTPDGCLFEASELPRTKRYVTKI